MTKATDGTPTAVTIETVEPITPAHALGTPIDVRWNAVLGALPAIGKNSRNQQQNFNYRSIDDVIDRLKPLFARHGVHVVPVRQEAYREERQTARGTSMYVCHITVDWEIRSVDGEIIHASTLGEGMDVADKATSKAQTMALKYLLWPALAIATNDDPDGESPEETVGNASGPADGGGNRTSWSPRSSGRAPGNSAGLIRKIAGDIGMDEAALKDFVVAAVGGDCDGDLDKLDPSTGSIVLGAIREHEREIKAR